MRAYTLFMGLVTLLLMFLVGARYHISFWYGFATDLAPGSLMGLSIRPGGRP